MELVQYKDAAIARDIQHPALKKVVDYLKTHDVSQEEKGTHTVSDDFFYNVIEMETTDEEHRVWESHRAYYDVHVLFEGKERISYNFLSNMKVEDYVKEEDWQQMSGTSLFDIHFTPGSILLLDPNDAHKTGLKVDRHKVFARSFLKCAYSLRGSFFSFQAGEIEQFLREGVLSSGH